MSEVEDILLGAEFATYREAAVTAVHPAGPQAVRETVRRRHRRAAVTVAAAVALAVAVPVAAHATLDRRGGAPPVPGETPAPTSSAPGPSPIAPTPTPSTAGPPLGPPDGRITRPQLLAAKLSLPAWRAGPGCPTEGIRLTADAREETNTLLALDHGDADGDGAPETVALVQCVLGTGGPMQVVAFDRDERGEIVTVGQVTRTVRSGPQWILGLEVTGAGVVRVEVADLAPGGGWPLDWSQRQWRGYRWTGDRFTQVAGPTSFGPNPHLSEAPAERADASITTPATATLIRQDDGSFLGRLTVTVRWNGDAAHEYLYVEAINLPKGVVIRGVEPPDLPSFHTWFTVPGGAFRKGEERTVDVLLRAEPGTAPGALGVTTVQVATRQGGELVADAHPTDNTASFSMSAVDGG
ncbi:hypothetical protein ACN26Y_10890 [Micromonospora sp. WMMD558]|uniref:hypothetical protein n=1 Tax=unclassified Micromonospora TaxID=2617518 RepID=UPI0012B47ED9|nr:hypothetical protein [Micromonospora sp. WMMC415]QGN46757.1 hypothetical protein GKC29_07790 [Micromonospora sp. WMMC415]